MKCLKQGCRWEGDYCRGYCAPHYKWAISTGEIPLLRPSERKPLPDPEVPPAIICAQPVTRAYLAISLEHPGERAIVLTHVKPKAANYREQVYKCIEQRGPVTDEEIAIYTHLNPSTARPRRVELASTGRIIASADTRRTRAGRQAVAWVVAPEGSF